MSLNYKRLLLAAEGYLELDMAEEAWEELNAVPSEEHTQPEYLQVRVQLLMRGESWEEALAASQKLTKALPHSSAGFIHAAYCLHELGHTTEARQMLLDGPPALLKEPTYYYNLGCYQAILGDLDDAKRLVKRSFELDQRLVEVARKDEDLKALWSEF